MEPYIFLGLCFYIEWKSVRLELLTSIYNSMKDRKRKIVYLKQQVFKKNVDNLPKAAMVAKSSATFVYKV